MSGVSMKLDLSAASNQPQVGTTMSDGELSGTTSSRKKKSFASSLKSLFSPRARSSTNGEGSSSTSSSVKSPRTPRGGALKKSDAKPTGPPPPIYADCYDDLPPDVQKILKEEKISADLTNKHWQIMVYILKFRLRRHIHKREDLVSMPIAVKHKVHVDLNNLDSGDIESLFNKLLNGEPLDDNEIGGFAGLPMEAVQGNQPTSGPAYVPFWNVSRWMETREKMFNEGDPKTIYTNLEYKAKGAFGSVCSAKDEKGHTVAVKIVPHKTPLQKATNLHELSVNSFCKHPNICHFYSSYLLTDEVWMVFEYLEGGTLTEACSRHIFEEREISFVARELLQALVYLHSNDIIHRDLKSLNVMMTTEGNIKLIDFGLCVDVSVVEGKCRKEMVGSPLWIAPEMVRGEPHSFPVDVWSFAICMLELANGIPPMVDQSYRAMLEYATIGVRKPFEKPDAWTPAFQSFIGRCLTIDPKTRATPTELLEERFVKKCNFSKKEMKELLSSTFIHDTLKMF